LFTVETALRDVDLGAVEAAVGPRSFARGREYATRRVLDLRWDAATEALEATVLGQGNVYETVAYFSADQSGRFGFVDGECSCPVGDNCKHIAAIVIAAVGRQAKSMPRTTAHARRRKPPERTWADALHALITAPAGDEGDAGGRVPLAIEVTLAADLTAGRASNPRLLARLVKRGRAGWVKSGVSWGGLDSWQMDRGGFPADQVNILRELYALHQAIARPGYRAFYASTNAERINFSAFDRSLWPLLDEARQVGLRLVHANPVLGEIRVDQRGEVCLDVTRPNGAGLRIAPELAIDSVETDVVAVAFIGARGHGVAYVERADIAAHADPAHWRVALAPLATPASPPLRAMVCAGEHVEVPLADEARFGEEVWPRLRQIATVVSSDGAFAPPEISPPRLELQASYGAGHAVELSWSWVYEVGTMTRRAPVDDDPDIAGYRDPEAEHHLARSLDLPVLDQLGLLAADGRPRPRARLTGLDTMRFATEVQPLLADNSDVLIDVTGEPADFSDVGDNVVVGLSTASAGETDWFDLTITITVDGRDLPFGEVFYALAAGDSHLLLPDGAYFSLRKPELQTLLRLIEEARALQDQPADAMRISRYQFGWWDELCEVGVVQHQADSWAQQASALRDIESIGTVDVPTTLTAELRPYQRDGFHWLRFLWEHELGGVLADDMGLGKTLQSLALVSHARQRDPNLAPFLVVAPTSVVPGWLSEARRFTPNLSVVTVTDTLKRSGRTIHDVVEGAHVVVMSYTLLRLDFDAYRSVEWAGLFLDEAQHSKNHRSKIYSCLRQLPAPFKVAITGTPMENNLMELWSLLSITAPGLFPSPTRFAERYARPIERNGDVEMLAQFRRRIKPLMKRRTKELVAAELPAKQELVLDVQLPPQHRKVYETHLQRERQKVLGLIDDFDRNRFTILRSLTLLRQLSLHPSLIGQTRDDVPCVKIDTLVEQLVEVIEGDHRALVFSQFTQFLHMVRSRLDREHVQYCYLDGRTRKREAVIARFKDGVAPVFLISLKAGGVGLNLTEADYCFLLDPWWNPATEAQAIDRSHRIGQTRNVIAYRMIAADTIEEKVMALKARKAHLFKGVMDDDNLFGGRLEAEDVRGLFT